MICLSALEMLLDCRDQRAGHFRLYHVRRTLANFYIAIIVTKPGNNMEVSMKDLLACSRAVVLRSKTTVLAQCWS
jgi:hypothetical protein